jgi:hypothetical protein
MENAMINHLAVQKEIYDLVCANAPMKAHVLFAHLSVHFLGSTKDEMRMLTFDLVERGIIVELKYEGLNANGLLYFPAETRFEFSRRKE